MTIPPTTSVATLITCHNRRDTTLTCLSRLFEQRLPPGVELHAYLVDDGSTDGTGAAVAREFPGVRVLQGNGQLFWCGGMRFAWAEAARGGHDHYLWLNDDTYLYPEALATMLATWTRLREREGRDLILAGATHDATTGRTTYGGVVAFRVIEPGPEPRRCETTCGNCVLVPRGVASTLGHLSSSFAHQLADFDYGLRGAKLGIPCWVAPGYVGTCSQHAVEGSHVDASLSLSERLRMMRRPAGPPPLREWMIFTYRHLGWRWPIYWLRALARACFPALWLVVRAQRARPASP